MLSPPAVGYYCVGNSTTYLDTECLTGRYCPENTTDSNEYRCAAGTFNPTAGATNISSCLDCTPGMYCQGEGNAAPTSNCRLVESQSISLRVWIENEWVSKAKKLVKRS